VCANTAGAAAYSGACQNPDCSCSSTHFYQQNADNLSESESAFTSELADLTIVHAQSDLTMSNDSRRTEEGFLIDPKRLHLTLIPYNGG
jgi:hypothetical protein